MTPIQIAQITHEANRIYCQSIGDFSQMPWEVADQWQRDSAISGVYYALENPDVTAKSLHEEWCQKKISDGWEYGPEKDPENKKHHCLVPYDELPEEQKKKDKIFQAIVLACK